MVRTVGSQWTSIQHGATRRLNWALTWSARKVKFNPRLPYVLDFPRCINTDIDQYVRIPMCPPLLDPKGETLLALHEEEEAILILTIPVIDNQCNVTCLSEDNTNACLYFYLLMAWWCTLVGHIQDAYWSFEYYLWLVTCIHYLHCDRCRCIHTYIYNNYYTKHPPNKLNKNRIEVSWGPTLIPQVRKLPVKQDKSLHTFKPLTISIVKDSHKNRDRHLLHGCFINAWHYQQEAMWLMAQLKEYICAVLWRYGDLILLGWKVCTWMVQFCILIIFHNVVNGIPLCKLYRHIE